jgi:hypothetical protein
LLERPSRKTLSRVGVYPRGLTIAETERLVARLARNKLDQLRQKGGRRRAPRNILDDVISEILVMLGDDGNVTLGDHSLETIRGLVTKRLKARRR